MGERHAVRAGAVGDRRKKLGFQGERAAEKFLSRRRYKVVARNYRCPLGELDLVALDGRTVVFVEVKTRTGRTCGTPLEAVGPRKRQQIIRVAEYFLTAHRLHDRCIRFDVVGVWWESGRPVCEVVQAAFGADD